MANNRLFLVDDTTGDSLMVATSFGGGWRWLKDVDEMSDWLAVRDMGASYGAASDMSVTRLRLETEHVCQRADQPPAPPRRMRANDGVTRDSYHGKEHEQFLACKVLGCEPVDSPPISQPPRQWTCDEVSATLCDLCKLGAPLTNHLGNIIGPDYVPGKYFHTVNDRF